MIDLMGDTELDILILPVVVTTLLFGQAVEACGNWFRRHVQFPWKSIAA